MEKLPPDYIRGLVEGEGTFTFSSRIQRLPDGSTQRIKTPAFAIKMHERDEELLKSIRDSLKLTNKVYKYHYDQPDGVKRGKHVLLIVREIDQIRNIVIPFFYKKLRGYKAKQFSEWIKQMGNTDMSKGTKETYNLFKSGYYDNPEK